MPESQSPQDRVLVLLPGLDGTLTLFEPLLAELAVEIRTVQYPAVLPTHYANLLPIVMKALPVARDFILLGWSFSGPLALMAAERKPPGLRGVVLSATFVQKPLPWIPKAAQFLVRSPLFWASGDTARIMARLGGYGSPQLLALITRAHDAIPPRVMAARIRQVLKVDVRPELQACHVPILYLGASQDSVVPRSNAATIQRLKPDVQVCFIEGPHLAMAIHPAQAAVALLRFMKSPTPPS